MEMSMTPVEKKKTQTPVEVDFSSIAPLVDAVNSTIRRRRQQHHPSPLTQWLCFDSVGSMKVVEAPNLTANVTCQEMSLPTLAKIILCQIVLTCFGIVKTSWREDQLDDHELKPASIDKNPLGKLHKTKDNKVSQNNLTR
ncbi:hypothetical protein L2E82_06015 [Cichorium intybus]|uniref:Uncharacterized protein n=1 Tax=Cichorium intybus TaxID=13427 RepID=A0ACB9HA17_CICIN|nr:hypothetical protein L2E82_06015 [Cichorium intybus]